MTQKLHVKYTTSDDMAQKVYASFESVRPTVLEQSVAVDHMQASSINNENLPQDAR
jgi:hypothetical protein